MTNVQTSKSYFDQQNARLTHRFFIYDTVSGIENSGGYQRGDLPKVVRMATSVRLTVELDSKNPESIKRPLLEILYSEEKTSKITESTTLRAEYFNDYYQGSSRLWKAMKGIFIAMNVLSALVVAIRLYSFYTHNYPQLLGSKFSPQFALYFVYYLFDVWSTIMFWVAFFTTAYWFVFYKM